MSALSLDDLRRGADAKYPDFEIEMEDGRVLGFKPVLRLPKAKRRAVADALDLKKRIDELPGWIAARVAQRWQSPKLAAV